MTDRIAAALERIADALEMQVSSDPLAMFASVLDDPGANEVHESFAGNGVTLLYKHPADGFQIVARRNDAVDGGYAVGVEKV